MKKKIYPKIIVDAGVTEEDIIQFEYSESDIKKLASIIEYEEKLSNSPLIAHHRKKKKVIQLEVNINFLKFAKMKHLFFLNLKAIKQNSMLHYAF